jgi:hypothetical protein
MDLRVDLWGAGGLYILYHGFVGTCLSLYVMIVNLPFLDYLQFGNILTTTTFESMNCPYFRLVTSRHLPYLYQRASQIEM